jgi:hypothetical protein
MKSPFLETLLEPEREMNDKDVIQTSNILDLVIEKKQTVPIAGVLIGKLVGFDGHRPLVGFESDVRRECLLARSTIPLTHQQIGNNVVVAFENGDERKPIITGLLWNSNSSPAKQPIVAQLDGERLSLTAEKEIVLRCGKASITLTRAGKVLIKGAYLLSRSSGVNSIKGGSVQIN